jgi:hypothetical protein
VAALREHVADRHGLQRHGEDRACRMVLRVAGRIRSSRIFWVGIDPAESDAATRDSLRHASRSQVVDSFMVRREVQPRRFRD